jgi:hypothetical protein
MAGAPNTTTRTRDMFTVLVDTALETAVTTCLNATLVTPTGAGAVRAVTRPQVLKWIARRALRKSTQGAMRPEMAITPPLTPGPSQ